MARPLTATQRYRNVKKHNQRHREHVDRVREMGGSSGMFDVRPTCANFGHVKVDCTYALDVAIKNIGTSSSRLRISPLPQDKTPGANIVRQNGMPGNIAPGMSANITITLDAQTLGNVDQSLEVVTESFTYHIPITAVVIDAIDFDVHAHRNTMVGKGTLISGVRVVQSGEKTNTAKLVKTKGPSPQLQPDDVKIRLQDISKYAVELRDRNKKQLRQLEAMMLEDEEVNGWEEPFTSAAVQVPSGAAADIDTPIGIVEEDDLEQDYNDIPSCKNAFWDNQCQQLCLDYTEWMPRQTWHVDASRPFDEMQQVFGDAQEQQEKRLRRLSTRTCTLAFLD